MVVAGWSFVTRVSGYWLIKSEWGIHEEREAYADCSWGLITSFFFLFFLL